MKKFVLTLLTAALLAGPALADTSIGVVNIGTIMQESKAASSARTQIQAKQKAFKADLDTKAKAFRDEDQALVKQRDKLDKATLEKKIKEFREKQANEERSVLSKKASLDKAFTASLEEIQKNVLEIVKQVASEKKMNLVLSTSQVLYNDEALDVTAEVLKRLDAKLPNVTLKF